MSNDPPDRFVFFRSYWESISMVPTKKRKAELITAICEVQFDGKPTENVVFSDQLLRMAWINIAPILKKSTEGRSNKIKALRSRPCQAPCQDPYQDPYQHKEKDKEGEGEKDIKDRSTKRKSKQTYSEKFEQFWKRYPRKQGKRKAFLSWKKHKCENGLFEEIMKSLQDHISCDQWKRDGGKFIPHGSTWVNGRCWEDEPQGKVEIWR